VPAIAEEELTAALARVRRQFRLEPGRAIIAGSEADHGVRETIRAILRRIRKTLVVPAFRHLIRTLVGQDLVGAHRHIHRLRREIDDLRALVQLQGDDIGRLHRSGDASRSRPCPTRILRSPHPQALVSGFAESDRGRDLLSNPVLSSLRQAQGEDRDREGSG
jgi:hypothetical protein